MFRIGTHQFRGQTIEFSENYRGQENAIDVVIGENGTGKTALLLSIVDECLEMEKHRPRSTGPSRVIVQTFSPFSRFRAPEKTVASMSDAYFSEVKPNDSFYTSVGFNRGTRRTGAGMARALVEEYLHSIAEDPERYASAGHALAYLGFRPRIKLSYTISRQLQDFNDFARRVYESDVPTSDELSQLFRRGDSRRARLPSAVMNEAKSVGPGVLLDRIFAACEVLQWQSLGLSAHIEIDFDEGKSLEMAELQATALLRRLGLADIRRCVLTRQDYSKVEIAETSSGQQQTICAILGLASKLKDDSLILIDEPELSLHPRWQQDFLKNLDNALRPYFGCHVVIATHSPLIVQGAVRSRCGVVTLNSLGGTPAPHDYAPRSLAISDSSSVESILFDAFDAPILNSNVVPNELFRITAHMNGVDASEREALLNRLDEIDARFENESGASRERRLIGLARDLIAQEETETNGLTNTLKGDTND